EPGTADQQRCYLDGRPNHLLEVIEHEQHLLLQEHGLQDVPHWAHSTFLDAERLRNGGQDQRRISDGGQVHEEHAISELLTQFCSHLQPQARFADATRTSQGEQPHIVTQQQVGDLRHVLLAANKGGELDRQIVWVQIEGPQGWKISRQVRSDKLEELE